MSSHRELTKRERRSILASVLQQPGRVRRDSPLVAFDGPGHPVSARAVVLIPCTELHASRLNVDQPVFGLPQARIPLAPEPGYLGAVAQWYLRELRSAGVESPYRLVGYCFGGLVAYEMARQIRASGGEVEYLELVETPAPGRSFKNFLRRRKWGMRLRRLRERGPLRRLQGTLSLGDAPSRGEAAQNGGAAQQNPGSAPQPNAGTPALMQATQDIALAYDPGRYAGAVQLVFAHETEVRDRFDPLAGWRTVVEGPLVETQTGGGHLTIFSEGEFLSGLVERLQKLSR